MKLNDSKEKASIELIYNAYYKSRHKELIKYFLPNTINCILNIMIIFVFFMIATIFLIKDSFYFWLFIILYNAYIYYEFTFISKSINEKINDEKDNRFKKFRNADMHILLGLPRRLFNKHDTKYAQVIYFQYLLDDLELNEIEINKCIHYLDYKLKDYVPTTEKSSFNAMISLVISLSISLSIWYFDKITIFEKLELNTFLIYFFVIIILIIPTLMFLFSFFSLIQSSESKALEIKNMLKLYKSIDSFKTKYN